MEELSFKNIISALCLCLISLVIVFASASTF